jgi:hypothetical protein
VSAPKYYVLITVLPFSFCFFFFFAKEKEDNNIRRTHVNNHPLLTLAVIVAEVIPNTSLPLLSTPVGPHTTVSVPGRLAALPLIPVELLRSALAVDFVRTIKAPAFAAVMRGRPPQRLRLGSAAFGIHISKGRSAVAAILPLTTSTLTDRLAAKGARASGFMT